MDIAVKLRDKIVKAKVIEKRKYTWLVQLPDGNIIVKKPKDILENYDFPIKQNKQPIENKKRKKIIYKIMEFFGVQV